MCIRDRQTDRLDCASYGRRSAASITKRRLQDDDGQVYSSFSQTRSPKELTGARDFEQRGFHRSYIKSLCRPRPAEDRFDAMSNDSYEQRPNKLAKEVQAQMIRSLSSGSIQRGRYSSMKSD